VLLARPLGTVRVEAVGKSHQGRPSPRLTTLESFLLRADEVIE
jgi:hypothetical protein